MKKNILIMILLLILSSCTNSSVYFEKQLIENVESSYGLTISSIIIEEGKVNITADNIIDTLKNLESKSNRLGLDSGSVTVSLFENLNNEIKLLDNDLLLGTVTDGTNEFFLHGYNYKSVYLNDEEYARDLITYKAYEKLSSESAAKSEQDYYDMFEGDEEWKLFVDSLFEIYEGVNE